MNGPSEKEERCEISSPRTTNLLMCVQTVLKERRSHYVMYRTPANVFTIRLQQNSAPVLDLLPESGQPLSEHLSHQAHPKISTAKEVPTTRTKQASLSCLYGRRNLGVSNAACSAGNPPEQTRQVHTELEVSKLQRRLQPTDTTYKRRKA